MIVFAHKSYVFEGAALKAPCTVHLFECGAIDRSVSTAVAGAKRKICLRLFSIYRNDSAGDIR